MEVINSLKVPIFNHLTRQYFKASIARGDQYKVSQKSTVGIFLINILRSKRVKEADVFYKTIIKEHLVTIQLHFEQKRFSNSTLTADQAATFEAFVLRHMEEHLCTFINSKRLDGEKIDHAIEQFLVLNNIEMNASNHELLRKKYYRLQLKKSLKTKSYGDS